MSKDNAGVATEKAIEEAYNTMHAVASERKLTIAKSDLNKEFTTSVEIALTLCMEYLECALAAIDEIDSDGTNYRDLDIRVHRDVNRLVRYIKRHKLWSHLQFDAEQEVKDCLGDVYTHLGMHDRADAVRKS